MNDGALNVVPGEAQPEQFSHGEGGGEDEDRLEGQGRLPKGQGAQHKPVEQKAQ